MVNKKLKRVLSLIMAFLITFGSSTSTIQVNASSGADVKYESDGATPVGSGGNGDGSGSSEADVWDAAGLKVSIVNCGKDLYYPDVNNVSQLKPFYSNKTPYGLMGTEIPKSFNDKEADNFGYYGIAPIYFVEHNEKDWKYGENEYGVEYINGRFKLGLKKKQMKGLIVQDRTDQSLIDAVRMAKQQYMSPNNKDYNKLTPSSIFDSFTVNSKYSMIYTSGTDTFQNLGLHGRMTDIKKQPTTEFDYNKAVIISIMYLISNKYESIGTKKGLDVSNEIVKLIKQVEVGNTEIMLLIEPMLKYKFNDGSENYITANAFAIGSSKSSITPENFPEKAKKFNWWYSNLYSEDTMRKNGLNIGETGLHYMLGMRKGSKPMGSIHTKTGGAGPNVKKSECIASKLTYVGPSAEQKTEFGVTSWKPSTGFVKNETKELKDDYKWGWGSICSYDYIPAVTKATMSTSTLTLLTDNATTLNMGMFGNNETGKLSGLEQNIKTALTGLNSAYLSAENPEEVQEEMKNEIIYALLEARKVSIKLALQRDEDGEIFDNTVTNADIEGRDTKDEINAFKDEGLSDEQLKEYEAVATFMLNGFDAKNEDGFCTEQNIQLVRYLYLRGESIRTESDTNIKLLDKMMKKINNKELTYNITINKSLLKPGLTPDMDMKSAKQLNEYQENAFMMKSAMNDIFLIEDSLIEGVDVSANVPSLDKFLSIADKTYGGSREEYLEEAIRNKLDVKNYDKALSGEESKELQMLLDKYEELNEEDRSDLSKALDDNGYVIKPISLYSGYLEFVPKFIFNTPTSDGDKYEIEFNEVDKNNSYITMPKTSLFKESSEIQTLITDYLADTQEFLRVVRDDIGEKELNERMQKELQIRILMYLDVIRDQRDGVSYSSYVTSEEGTKDRTWTKSIVNNEWGMEIGNGINYTKNTEQDAALSMVYCNIPKVDLNRIYGKISTKEYVVCPNYTTVKANSGLRRVIQIKADKASLKGLETELLGSINKDKDTKIKINKNTIVKKGNKAFVNTIELLNLIDKNNISYKNRTEVMNTIRKYSYSKDGSENGINIRLNKLSQKNGTQNIVSALMNNFMGYKSSESDLLYGIMEVVDGNKINGIAYHGLLGQKYVSYINSDAIAKLVQCTTLVSTYCKAETGVLTGAATDKSLAIYYFPGTIRALVQNPWGDDKSGIKVSQIPLSNVNDSTTKSYTTVMNAGDTNVDTRLSTFDDIVLNPKNSSHIDALATTVLADTLGSDMEVKEVVNAEGTFVNQRLVGQYGFGGAIVQTAIPVDVVVLYRNKEGMITRKEVSENATGAIPEMLSSYKLTDLSAITSAYKNLKISYAFVNPSASNRNLENDKFITYLMKVMDEMDEGKETSRNLSDAPDGTIAVEDAKVIMQKYPFEYNYKDKTTGKNKNIKNKLLYTLSMQDGFNYAINTESYKGRKAQIVIVADELEGIRQINVTTDENGNLYDVKKAMPDAVNNVDSTKKVTLEDEIESKGRKAELVDWTVKNELGKVEDVKSWDTSGAIKNGTKEVIDVVDWGQTIYVHYKLGAAKENGNIKILQKEISKKYSLADLANYDKEVPIKATGIWAKVQKVEPIEHQYFKDDGCASSSSTNAETGEVSTRRYCGGHRCTLYSEIINPLAVSKYKNTGISGSNSKVVANATGFKYKEVKGTTEFRGNWNWNKMTENIVPNLEFVVWRYNDVPTIASYKNNNTELGNLGLPSGKKPSGNRSEKYTTTCNFTTGFEVDEKSLVNPIYQYIYHVDSNCTEANLDHGQYNTKKSKVEYGKKDINYEVAIEIDNYIDENNKGTTQGSDESIGSFKIGDKSFEHAVGYASTPKEYIKFYPYIEMQYDTMEDKAKKVNILAEGLSTIKNSDYVDIGWNKTAALSLTMDSKQWSTHFRATNVAGKNSVLAGGAIYNISQGKEKTYVGIRTWQTVLPNTITSDVVDGGEYYKSEKADSRRNSLIDGIKDSLDKLEIVQHIKEGISQNPKEVMTGGLELKAIKGQSERVLGENTSKDSKYYLKRNTNKKGTHTADDANLDILSKESAEKVGQTTYTIKSDVDGKVWITKNKNKLKEIGASEGLTEILDGSSELTMLDSKTKLITNFLKAVDRNKGSYKGNKWYHEAWDGISVVVTNYIIDVGLGDTKIRVSALDPKLVDDIESKSDIYNPEKFRSSVFMTSIKAQGNGSKPIGWVGVWGDDNTNIKIKDIAYMFTSKVFYIPNATVQDLN